MSGTFRKSTGVVFAITLCAIITGCQSLGPVGGPEEEPLEKIVLEPIEQGTFTPANFIARVHFDGGQYPNLFSPTTHAVWVDQHISDIKLAAENQSGSETVDTELVDVAGTINQNFMVIECHVETLFQDSSIAYDMASLRNLDVYLETDAGKKIYPIQQILGSSAGESQVGALKRFDRLNLLVFPMVDVITEQPNIPVGVASMNLVIEGFDSRYTFGWIAQGPVAAPVADSGAKPDIADVITWRPNQSETVQLLKVRFTELYSKLAALTRLPRN